MRVVCIYMKLLQTLRKIYVCTGYQRLKENVTNGLADNHEAIDFYRPVEQPDKSRPLWGENQWPSDESVPGFKATYEKWIEKMKELGLIVVRSSRGVIMCVHRPADGGVSTFYIFVVVPRWLVAPRSAL